MKPAAFDYLRAASLREATSALTQAGEGARLVAGCQSLGPMLNLRLAQPSLLIDITAVPELLRVEHASDAVTIGACITTGDIEDGRAGDESLTMLPAIAGGIAYRAVRNRGTVGGSLCHADPAADWGCTLTALGASVTTWSEGGGRAIPLAQFVTGAFRTVLAPGEIVQAVRVPRRSREARWGYYKACRKPGEFAHAMAAVLDDPARGVRRAVIGAVGGPPVVLEGERVTAAAAEEALRAAGLDAVARRMQAVALKRALAEAAA